MLPDWKQHEFDTAIKNKGKRHAFSGARGGLPADIDAGDFRHDCKSTIHKSFSITTEIWRKIRREALSGGFLPAVSTLIKDDQGPVKLVTIDEDDFVALNEELEELRKLATKPKKSAAARHVVKAQKFDGVSIYQLVQEYWLKQQQLNKDNFVWSGNISPSAQITKSTCIKKFFSQVSYFLEFPPDTLMSVCMGTLLHSAFEREYRNFREFLYPFPLYPDDPELKAWQVKIQPEYAVWCRASGIKGKIDAILEEEGEPIVDDLKFVWQTPEQWAKFMKAARAKQTHQTQVRLYANRLNATNAYPGVRIVRCRVSYMNVMMRPFSKNSVLEVPVSYTTQDASDINYLVEALWKGREQKLQDRYVHCTNRGCPIHSTDLLKEYFI